MRVASRQSTKKPVTEAEAIRLAQAELTLHLLSFCTLASPALVLRFVPGSHGE